MISVVMTTCNGEKYVAAQIESILDQTFSNYEFLIADDVSTDTTPEILQRYAQADGRIQLFFNSKNIGLHKNLEQTLLRTRGALIAISDQDDIWEPDKLERLLASLGNKSAAYSDSLLVDEYGESLGLTLLQRIGIPKPDRNHPAIALLRKNCISGHALLFQRHLIEVALPFSNQLMFDQQIGFLAAISGGVEYVDGALVKHRIHGLNQTNGGLLPQSSSDSENRSMQREPRVERFRKRRLDLADRLAWSSVWLQRIGSIPGDWSKSKKLVKNMVFLANRLRGFDNSWFDLRLFLLLLIMRNQVFYADETHVLARCVRYAKGARYYSRRYGA